MLNEIKLISAVFLFDKLGMYVFTRESVSSFSFYSFN